MNCLRCGTRLDPDDATCPKCQLVRPPGPLPQREPAPIWPPPVARLEHKTLTVPLGLVFVGERVSPLQQVAFVQVYRRLVQGAIDRAARDGWAVQGPTDWETMVKSGRMVMGWWDRLLMALGSQRPVTFRAVRLTLQRLQVTLPLEQPGAAVSTAPAARRAGRARRMDPAS